MLTKIDRKQITETKYKQAEALKEIIVQEFNVKWKQIAKKNNCKDVVMARHTYFYILYFYIGFNTTEAAKTIGMDHSTVVSALKKIEGFYEVGDMMVSLIENTKNRLNEYLAKA